MQEFHMINSLNRKAVLKISERYQEPIHERVSFSAVQELQINFNKIFLNTACLIPV